MCSVCGTNRKFTEKILKELQDCIEASKKGQARKDRLERTGSKGQARKDRLERTGSKGQARKDRLERTSTTTSGPMDYDFDCCDCSYSVLEDTIWKALAWLKIVPEEK